METRDWETLHRVCYFCWRDHDSPTTLYFATTCPSYNIQSHLLRSQNMEIKGKQKNCNGKMMKRRKKLVESRSQARAAFLLPQLSDIPMKAHKLGVALRRPTKSRKKRNATEGFREKQLQQMFWRLLAFESWLKVVSAFEWERERGGGKIERSLKHGRLVFLDSKGKIPFFLFSTKFLLCIFQCLLSYLQSSCLK